MLLAVGVFRFAKLWVDPRAAAFAALATVFLGSESFLVYSAGQLGTTMAAPLYLNALPYLYEWVRRGNWRSLAKGASLCVAAAAAHHATLLFGSVLFAAPVLALALLDRVPDEQEPLRAVIVRMVGAVVLVGVGIAVVLLPFWIALIHYPVTQTPIPHASRSNFLLSPRWGLNYFLIPYGAVLLSPSVYRVARVLERFGCGLCCWDFGWRFCWGWAERRLWESYCWGAHLKSSPWNASLIGRHCWRCRLSDCW
jgi:hypothetical protein